MPILQTGRGPSPPWSSASNVWRKNRWTRRGRMSSGACEYGRMDAKSREETRSRQAPAVLDTRAAADFLGVSARTLEGLRVRGGGPRFVKVGGSVRYRIASL